MGAHGRAGRPRRREGPPVASTSSTGRPSTRASSRSSSMVMEVARGRARPGPGDRSSSSPATCTTPTSPRSSTRSARHGAQSRIVQAVCSPIRNPMPRRSGRVMSLFAQGARAPDAVLVAAQREGARRRLPVDGHRRAVVRQQPRPREVRGRRPRAQLGHRRRRGRPTSTRGCSRCMPRASTRSRPRPASGSAPGSVQG